MWFFIAFLAVIALLVLYLNQRGASGAGDNFHMGDPEGLAWLGAKHGEIKKNP